MTPQNTEHGNSAYSPGSSVSVLSQLENLLEQAKASALIEQLENIIKTTLMDMMNLLNQDANLLINKYMNKIIQEM